MKHSITKFVAAALVVTGTVASAPAVADIVLPNTGNGEFVLYVRDLNNPTRIYARGLGIQINSALSEGQAGGSYAGPGQPIPFTLGTIGPDATLTTFLQTTSSYVWTIVAGDSLGTANTFGTQRYVTTIQEDVPQLTSNLGLRNWAQLDARLSELNGELPDGPGTSTTNGNWQDFTGNNMETWFNFGPNNANPLDQAANFFVYATGGGGNGSPVRIFQALDVTLSSTGTLSQVPLPAAVWLLLSGIIGVAGIGRRRAAAPTAA